MKNQNSNQPPENSKQDTLIRSAQYRKSLSIAFFNATNAAVELVKNTTAETSDEKEMIIKWRDWFLSEHKKYYAEVIANIGQPYDAAESIAKLRQAKTMDELKAVWLAFSADERQDKIIIQEAQKLKLKL